MENVTTNVKIVGELPFQRLVNFFLWNIDEKAEHDFNVVEEKYDPSTHKDVSFESGKETDTLKTVSGFVKFTYKGEAGSVSYNYRNHLKFDKKDLFDNAINGTYRLGNIQTRYFFNNRPNNGIFFYFNYGYGKACYVFCRKHQTF